MMPSEPTRILRGPRLLVQWEPRWPGFVSSVKVVVRRCRAPKIYAVPAGIPSRSPLSLILLHFALLFCVLSMEPWLRSEWRALSLPSPSIRDFSGELVYLPQGLPELSDVSGAEAGRSGTTGGSEAHHPQQVIRIARDRKVVDTVVDAPRLRLPRTQERVANLVAFSPPQPLPPTQGIRRQSPVAPVLAHEIIMPAPAVRRERLSSSLTVPEAVVVPPAPVVQRAQVMPRLEMPSAEVVPPPPNDLRSDGSQLRALGMPAPNVVPPAPTGIRNEGALRSLAHVVGQPEVQAPATPVQSPAANDLIMSTNVGERVGAPIGGPGALAMSPKGDSSQGVGGTGGGSGIDRGSGTGAGKSGDGSGGTTVGDGRGKDLNAHGGLNPTPGPGGTGAGNGQKATSGITISGGVVHVPSFGTANARDLPERGPVTSGQAPAVVIIASPRAGGALNADLAPRGARVYTIYLATRIGTAVLQYADPDVSGSFQADLVAPQPLRTELPSGVETTHAVVSGIIDRVGILRNLQIMRADQPELAAKLIDALRDWRFRPVLRSNSAIEVNAVLGFGISRK